MFFSRLDEARQPEANRLVGLTTAHPRLQVLQALVQQYADGFAGRSAGESVVERLLPELHAQGADGRVRDKLGEADELEVEGAEGGIGILDGRGDEAADEMCIIVTRSVICVSGP